MNLPHVPVVLLASLCLAVPLSAQTKGSYKLFGKGCEGAAFTNQGVPTIGKTFSLVLSTGVRPPHLPLAILHIGASDSQWGPLRLPFDLTPFGAKGCSLLVSGEIALRPIATTPHQIKVSLHIPNDKILVGLRFFNQFIVLNPHNKPLKFSTSNGGVGEIGT